MLGLLVQILLSGNENIEVVSSRLQSTSNTRLEVWGLYTRLTMESPLFGYGFDGLNRAVYGEKLIEFVSQYRFINVPQVHNHYLGFAVRFGIPGLLIQLSIMFVAFITAWRVVFKRSTISVEDKKAYILPAALLAVALLEGLFEDPMGSTGKGSLHGLVFGTCAYLVVVYGRKLLAEAESIGQEDFNPKRNSALI